MPQSIAFQTARPAQLKPYTAFSGDPALKGGAGLYSSKSWIIFAVSSPQSLAATNNPKSMPAVTPPPVIRLSHTRENH